MVPKTVFVTREIQVFPSRFKPWNSKKNGVKFSRNNIHEWSPKKIFAEKDLYTTKWGSLINTDIEEYFFGKIDHRSKKALEYFAEFDGTKISEKSFKNFLNFMSIQKLRTPKGLSHLSRQVGEDKNRNLILLQDIQSMFCAIWTESVLSLIHIWRCRRSTLCRSRWSPYH